MKKYAIVSFLVIPLLLSGCSVQKKSTTATTAPPVVNITSSTNTNPAVGAQTTETAGADSAAIETQYQTNFTTATTDANQILQNKAKFCSVMVKFSGADTTVANDQFFFFYADELLTDYYWLVEFDGSNSNAKKRYFAAKRDFKDEITCATTIPRTPPSFVESFKNYLTQYQIPNTTVSLQMSLKDTVWNIIAHDSTGATTSSGQAKMSSATTSPSANTTQTVSTNDSTI